MDDPQAGIEYGGCGVEVPPQHNGVLDAQHVVLRVGPHEAEEMSIEI